MSGAESDNQRSIGRFRIEGPLGSGGMGDVYRAHDPVLDRRVALKVVRGEPSGSSSGSSGSGGDRDRPMRRVLREARAAAALSHPNTVTIFEVGVSDRDENEVFLAMELLEGEDLRKVLERGEASLVDKLRWLLEAARALSAAHERGLVHRDVKPENMFVCKDGTLKLLDFGIAKRGRSTEEAEDGEGDREANGDLDSPESVMPSSLQTELGKKVGTPRYMAPEQHAGLPTDPRTDQFAWGLVAFELLAGVHPLEEQVTVERPDDLGAFPSSEERRAALAAKLPDLAPPIVDAIARALAPAQADRFPSMEAIVAALEAPPSKPVPTPAVSDPPAPPALERPSPARPTHRPVQGRLLVVAAALAAGALALGFGLRRRAQRPKPVVATSPSIPLQPALVAQAACRVEGSQSFDLADGDRMLVLPDGSRFAFRATAKGDKPRFEQELGGAFVPRTIPILEHMPAEFFDEIDIGAVLFRGKPMVLATLGKRINGNLTVSFSLDGSEGSVSRNGGGVTGIAVAPFGGDLLYVLARGAVSPIATPRGAPHPLSPGPAVPPGIEGLYRSNDKPQHIVIETGDVETIALATHNDRAAVAYDQSGLKLALVNADLQPLGDRITIASDGGKPAVAFAGESAVVFWRHDDGPRARLMTSELPFGETAARPPRIVTDDQLGPGVPIAGVLPSGDWVIAFVAVRGGQSTLRIAPIGPAGGIGAPAEVPVPGAIRDLGRTTTKDGIDWYWSEGRRFRTVHVTCGARG